MSDPSNHLQKQVDAAIAAYLNLADAGNPPDRATFIERHSSIADELKSFFANYDDLRCRAQMIPNGVAQPCDDGSQSPQPLLTGSLISNDADISHSTKPSYPRYFGDYELLHEIDRGGMGVVYKARQLSLNRVVALKMIISGRLASQQDIKRFRTEAEAAAHLDHPGIVPIFHVGECEGQHFFSMAYVNGPSLATLLRRGPLPPFAAATMLRKVCDAVQCAHEHDIIHRDLKPANILLEPTGEATEVPLPNRATELVLLQARPRITDFGLAKRLNDESALTKTGQVLGTPSYMSPEQAGGATEEVGRASDVYSLGAILYQLLTGKPPFQAATPFDTLQQILDSEPVPPRLLNRSIPGELEAICLKCLAKTPADRYGTAQDLADDLNRYLEGEAIQASGVNLLDRVTRALRQSRHDEQLQGWGLGLIAFGFVILLGHIAIFAMENETSRFSYFAPRTAMFVALAMILWRYRHQSIFPTNRAERIIWVVWTGYVLALGFVNAVRKVFGHDQLESYAFFAVLTGFGFLVMGGHTWGGGYVIGLVFMLSAPLLALHVQVASLAFGVLWGCALLAFGLHYWRRGQQS